jgi:hypothetical protein
LTPLDLPKGKGLGNINIKHKTKSLSYIFLISNDNKYKYNEQFATADQIISKYTYIMYMSQTCGSIGEPRDTKEVLNRRSWFKPRKVTFAYKNNVLLCIYGGSKIYM